MIRDISVMIAGQAGDGVLFTGNVLAKILKRQGWEVFTSRDFPSNIRGEATNYVIRASLEKICGQDDEADVLLAFDCESLFLHSPKLAQRGTVLCDGEETEKLEPSCEKGRACHKFPLRRLARDNFGQEIFKNMVALGALGYILDLKSEVIEQIISEMFLARKGEDIVRRNIQAVKVGWEKAKEVIRDHERRPLTARKDLDRLLISGDEAIGLGALVAGCRVFAAYPICPASEIWQWLIRYLPRFNGAVVQTEDEVAALNMTLGAAYAGARAMTSTSGPGASLMMEAFSLSGMAEIPVVVAHVQRLGPGTGIPTKTAQGDTNQWIFGSHGEFPRIVLSPGTVEESFEFTVKAFNLAEKYQCPVIVLTELALGQNYQTVRTFDLSRQKIDRGKLLDPGSLPAANGYKRYKFTPDGVSARAIPSMKNGVHMVEGNEHDEKGYRNEEPENRARMMEKRMRKLRAAAKEVVPPKTHGDQAARIGMIGYGATLGPSLEAIAYLKKKGTNVKFLQLRTLWPFPAAQVEKFLEGCRSIFVVENNYSGQLQTLIRSQVRTDWEMSGIRKYTTATFRPGDIVSQVQGHLRQ